MSKEKFENIMKGLRIKVGTIVLAAGLAVTTPVSTFAKSNKAESPREGNSIVAMNNESILFDVTNEEEVRYAAERIYEEIKPMLEAENDPYLNAIATIENIEDMIRVLNGELPMNREFNENTVDQIIQLHADIFANRGHVDNTLYDIKYENFFETGSIEAMYARAYARTYDELYAKIAEARRTGNIGEFIELAKDLASKIYNEWYLAGLYGGFNPYALEERKQYLALLAATSRYNNFVLEYAQQNDLTICIPTCYKGEADLEAIKNSPEFKEKLDEAIRDNNFDMLNEWLKDQKELAEYEQREINEIMYGLYSGENQFGEVILTRGYNEKFVPFAYAYDNLNNILETKVTKSEAQVKALK